MGQSNVVFTGDEFIDSQLTRGPSLVAIVVNGWNYQKSNVNHGLSKIHKATAKCVLEEATSCSSVTRAAALISTPQP